MKKVYLSIVACLLSISINAQDAKIELSESMSGILSPDVSMRLYDPTTSFLIINQTQDILPFYQNPIFKDLVTNNHRPPDYLHYVLYDQHGNQLYKRHNCRTYKYDYSIQYTPYEVILLMIKESLE